MAAKDLAVASRDFVDPRIEIPVVDLSIAHFGIDPRAIPRARATLHYRNLWPESDFHGYRFASDQERADAPSVRYRQQLNSAGSPSDTVAAGYRWTPGTELSDEAKALIAH